MSIQEQGGIFNDRPDPSLKFETLPDRSGIELRSFVLEGKTYEVIVKKAYSPWEHGKIVPGAGQIGVYEIRALDHDPEFALIKDYWGANGAWKVELIIKYPTERDLKGEVSLMKEGLFLMDYLFGKV